MMTPRSFKPPSMHKTFRAADIMCALHLPRCGTALPLIPSYHDHAIGKKIGIMPEADRIVASVNLHRNCTTITAD